MQKTLLGYAHPSNIFYMYERLLLASLAKKRGGSFSGKARKRTTFPFCERSEQ
ncbi:MAG: hypothetical protein U5L45_04450 [Saprospiraceae bacterium]|nr:hypothetical protein [Saprospiraceae bacterium]